MLLTLSVWSSHLKNQSTVLLQSIAWGKLNWRNPAPICYIQGKKPLPPHAGRWLNHCASVESPSDWESTQEKRVSIPGRQTIQKNAEKGHQVQLIWVFFTWDPVRSQSFPSIITWTYYVVNAVQQKLCLSALCRIPRHSTTPSMAKLTVEHSGFPELTA